MDSDIFDKILGNKLTQEDLSFRIGLLAQRGPRGEIFEKGNLRLALEALQTYKDINGND